MKKYRLKCSWKNHLEEEKDITMVRDTTTTTPKAKTSFHSVKFSTDDNIFSASLQVVSHLCFYNKRRFESKVMDNHVNFYIMYHVL